LTDGDLVRGDELEGKDIGCRIEILALLQDGTGAIGKGECESAAFRDLGRGRSGGR